MSAFGGLADIRNSGGYQSFESGMGWCDASIDCDAIRRTATEIDRVN